MRWILILILKESQTEALHDLQYKETNKLYGTSVCNEMCSKCNRFFILYKGNKIYYVTTANIDNNISHVIKNIYLSWIRYIQNFLRRL